MTAEEIKKIRIMMGMSQERLARELGVSFCTVNRWERGKTAPSPMAEEKLGEFRERLKSTHNDNRRGSIRMLSAYPIRVEPIADGTLQSMDNAFDACTADLSLGGLRFDTRRPIVRGNRLKISIDFPFDEVPFEVLSSVKWTTDFGARRDVGVAFDGVDKCNIDRLKDALLTVPRHH